MINSELTYKKLIQEVETAIKQNLKFSLYSDDNSWYDEAPSCAGVYLIWKENILVYVGETSNIKKRMRDIQDTKNHTLRRKIGRKHFSNEQGFLPATSSHKFPNDIERKITHYMKEHFEVTYIPLHLGRKEVEEYFLRLKQPTYNYPSKRRNGLLK